MTALAVDRENLESGNVARTAWTTTPANYDIANSDPLKNALSGRAEGRPCRRIMVATSGTLVYTGLDGVNVTLPAFPNGSVFDIQAINLVASGSTAQGVVVIW